MLLYYVASGAHFDVTIWLQVVEEILTILAGILHLGNVKFHMDGGAQITNRDGE